MQSSLQSSRQSFGGHKRSQNQPGMPHSSSVGGPSIQPQAQHPKRGQKPSKGQKAKVKAALKQWVECVQTWYPNLLGQTHCYPPLYFNRVMYDVEIVADHSVLVPIPASDQARTLPPPVYPSPLCPPPPVDQASAGSVWSPLPFTPTPVTHVLDSDVRDDAAMGCLLGCLRKLGEERGEVMMVVSQLNFRKYLDNQTDPINRAACMFLPRPANLGYKDGDFDVLVIHRLYGVLVVEVKSVGANLTKTPDLNQAVVKTMGKALTQLQKLEDVLRHLVSDVAPVRITKALALPNISSVQLQKAVHIDPGFIQTVCQGLTSTTLGKVMAQCFCTDSISQPLTWWDSVLLGQGSDPSMTDDIYKSLVARFCGPASTVEIWTPTPPRSVVRTWGEAVAEAGSRFSALALTPEQVRLLNDPALTCMHLQGPPGCGKTVVLVLKALQWLKQGQCVHLVSLVPSGHSVATLIKGQLEKSGGQTVTGAVHLHLYQFDELRDVDQAVVELRSKQNADGQLFVIVDEVYESDRENWLHLLTELHNSVPSLCVWSAGMYRMDIPTTFPSLPPWLAIRTLCVSLRCPPPVTREVEQAKLIDDTKIPRYSTPGHPVPTEGPAVKWLFHRNRSCHSGDLPWQCNGCAEQVLHVLLELQVNLQDQPLQWRDVFILSMAGKEPSETDKFVNRLSDHYGIPISVKASGMTESERKDIALAVDNHVIVTDHRNVCGLERRVVIGMTGGLALGGTDRAILMSRSTGYLIYIDPTEGDDDKKDSVSIDEDEDRDLFDLYD